MGPGSAACYSTPHNEVFKESSQRQDGSQELQSGQKLTGTDGAA